MISRYSRNNITWIDLESPSGDEVRKVMEEYSLHPLVAQELIGPTLRPKVEVYQNYIYIILHFPTLRHKNGRREIRQQEVDFIVGRDFLITSRYETVDPIHRFAKLFEVDSILERPIAGTHAGFVFFHMITRLYISLLRELEGINDSIEEIEDRIFKGEERRMVVYISNVSRELLDFKRATNLHREVLASFEKAGRRFFGDEFGYYLEAIIGDYYKVENGIRASSELIGELRETNNSLLNSRQNEIMKIITVVAFVTLPMALITNFFQMSTVHTPIIGLPNDWLIITLGIVLVTFTLLAIAKIKRWF